MWRRINKKSPRRKNVLSKAILTQLGNRKCAENKINWNSMHLKHCNTFAFGIGSLGTDSVPLCIFRGIIFHPLRTLFKLQNRCSARSQSLSAMAAINFVCYANSVMVMFRRKVSFFDRFRDQRSVPGPKARGIFGDYDDHSLFTRLRISYLDWRKLVRDFSGKSEIWVENPRTDPMIRWVIKCYHLLYANQEYPQISKSGRGWWKRYR